MPWTKRELKLFDALQAISSYLPPAKLKKNSWGDLGVSGEDAVEMAYENVLEEAKLGLKGIRKPSRDDRDCPVKNR